MPDAFLIGHLRSADQLGTHTQEGLGGAKLKHCAFGQQKSVQQ